VALAACLTACQGCATLQSAFVYTVDRLNDTGDMVDLGISVSWKRCFSLYLCGLGLATAGGGYFDGWFVGLGGGSLGVKRCYHCAVGLVVYSYEESAWGTFDLDDPSTISHRNVGLLGWLFFPQPPGGAAPS